ncbi:dirigent protein [Streptomyces sp. NPDC014861]|uniref:dirigent protein n=1 Tax=Streptomyces sp. NPDC014861 TaxID=3364923 RepID=UPI0036F5992A
MTRTLRRIGALGAATVAAVAFSAAAPVAAAPEPAANGFEFTLYAKEVPTDEGGEETQAPEVGDSFAFADDLSRTKGGESVGRDGVGCTVVRAGNPADLLCVGTFVLNGGPGGQISGQTLLSVDPTDDAPAAYDIAVTGGTGDFKDVRGYIRSTPDGDHSRLEFHLTR